jgi:hypothetical protein
MITKKTQMGVSELKSSAFKVTNLLHAMPKEKIQEIYSFLGESEEEI